MAAFIKQPPGARGTRSLAVKASLDPAASDAENMVFRIELSHPAEQTVVLIYGMSRARPRRARTSSRSRAW